MIRIAVCDDDINYLNQNLKKHIVCAKKISGIDARIEIFTDGNMLLKKFEEHKSFDIVILDIDMPKINGKELAKKLRMIDSCFYLVFVTSYSCEIRNVVQYKIDAFIDKSDEPQKMINEFARVFNNYKEYRPKYVAEEIINTVNDEEFVSLIKIPLDNVNYFNMIDKKIYLHTGTEAIRLYEKVFGNIISKYSDLGFCQCYRNFLVNICKVYKVNDYCITLDNMQQLPLSRRNRSMILQAISKLLSDESK